MSSTNDHREPLLGTAPEDTAYDATAASARVARRGSLVTGLVAVVVLALVGVVAAEGWYLWLRPGATVSASHPVVTGAIASQAGVAAARQDAEAIFSSSWRGYDAHTAQVSTLMTPSFAARYQAQAGRLRATVLRDRIETRTQVRQAGVMTASADTVTALLFVDSYTTTHGKSGSLTTRRAMLTLVRSGSAWLVADVATS